MLSFDWNEVKNEKLKSERGIGFEDVVKAFLGGGLIKIIDHPNREKYPKQKIIFLNIKNYVYLVPFVRNKDIFFLKTIIPSSKFTKKLLIKKQNEEVEVN